MKKVDEKYYDKLTQAIGDVRVCKAKNLNFSGDRNNNINFNNSYNMKSNNFSMRRNSLNNSSKRLLVKKNENNYMKEF